MYLSKLILNPRDVYAKQCMSDCQKMHRSIMRLFNCSRNDAGVLYRFNQEQFSVYVLSKIEPDCTNVPAGMKVSGICCLNKMEQMLKETSTFSFDLITSPCKKVAAQNQKNSRRRFLETAEGRMKWLERKATQNGFQVIHAEEELLEPIFGKHDVQNGGSFYCTSVRFFGIFKVTDKEKFFRAYCHGIGPGKAYGQGMLLLRRAKF